MGTNTRARTAIFDRPQRSAPVTERPEQPRALGEVTSADYNAQRGKIKLTVWVDHPDERRWGKIHAGDTVEVRTIARVVSQSWPVCCCGD
jgi:hypothetical protein